MVGKEGRKPSYEDVLRCYHNLVKQGEKPTYRAILNAVGGSPNVLQGHLKKIQEIYDQAATQSVTIQDYVITTLQCAIAEHTDQHTGRLNETVRQQGEDLQEANSRLTAAVDECKTLQQALQDQAGEAQNQRIVLERKLSAAGQRIADQVLQISELEKDRQALKAARKENAGLERDLKRVTDRELEERARANEAEKQLWKMQEMSAEAGKREASLAAQLSELRDRLQILGEREGKWAKDLLQSNQSIQDLTADRTALARDLVASQASLAEREKAAQELSRRLEDVLADRHTAEKERKELLAELRRSEASRAEAEKSLAVSEVKLAQCFEKIAERKGEKPKKVSAPKGEEPHPSGRSPGKESP